MAGKDVERYTEQQLVEILRRAAERQEGLNTEPDGRFSLAEIRPLAITAAAVVSVGWPGVGAWFAMRGIWRRAARPWPERVESLGQALVAGAQRAIDAARTSTD